MTLIASHFPSPIADFIRTSAPQERGEALVRVGLRASAAALGIFAYYRFAPSGMDSNVWTNMAICLGGCLSLPATMMALAMKNHRIVVGYGLLVAHDKLNFGLLEFAFTPIAKKYAQPVLKKCSLVLCPQPLKDLNPLTDPKKWVLTVQRVGAAAIGVFLLIRYPNTFPPMINLVFIPIASYFFLSAPATRIAMTMAITFFAVKTSLQKDWMMAVPAVLTTLYAFTELRDYEAKLRPSDVFPSGNYLDDGFVWVAGKCSQYLRQKK